MADWKKNRQKFLMPHDRVERCMRYVKAVEKAKRKAEKAKKGRSATGACARNGQEPFDFTLRGSTLCSPTR